MQSRRSPVLPPPPVIRALLVRALLSSLLVAVLVPALFAGLLAGLLAWAGTTSAAATATPSGSTDATPVGRWPLLPAPEVVRAFEPPTDPWAAGHRGVDLAGAVGQPVRAAMVGTIAFAGRVAGRPVVTVSHGDTRTTYEPVSSDLQVGDAVAAGERIGSLEQSLSHCFPRACLHWGWVRGETYLDPLDLVGDHQVRLLPLWRDEPVDHSAEDWQTALLPYAAWSPLLQDFPALRAEHLRTMS